MPKVIQPVEENGKICYGVFSTIVMDFMTPFYDSLEELKTNHPEYAHLRVYNILSDKIPKCENGVIRFRVHVLGAAQNTLKAVQV
ncbi:MAG: hypothetical protein NWF09_07555 [Candidatus Bathyarchaeota archaeon]|nr:hypothetical protein [Candidatus Bathyarchaeota archaeon]